MNDSNATSRMVKLSLSLATAVCALVASAHADVFRWDNGELIPSSDEIEPGPGVDASFRVLLYADLQSLDLRGADFHYSELQYAKFNDSDLRESNIDNSNLAYASFASSNLSNSIVAGNLTGTVLQGANLTHATLGGVFTDTNLMNADLSNSRFGMSSFSNADFRGANIRSADFLEVATMDGATFNSNSVYDQWTIFPSGFDPGRHGLTFVPEPSCASLASLGVLLVIRRFRRGRTVL